MVSCVRLNCLGDVHVDRRPECEALSIPAKHSIFAQAPTPLSERIELPVVVQRLPGSVPEWQTPAKKKAYMGPMSPWCNQDATFLHLGVDPKREDFMNGGYSFGFAPMGWQDDVGTVIVARKDKKPLLPEHVAALTKYCREGLEDYFQECAEGNMTKERVLKEITKAKFETYYKKWQERQEDETARTQVSPYEI
ncbi:hypothetical protein BDV96DRAFT_499663 [Lophiotrema nucula]|uniref:Uncharacterized protein n=1 Tax=Lophiotrema nucula TaxID=690887 RepID=A0A6A5YX29_9PLEO|nr:hypothetical protein BDV96DRAFT_499663 [Lophiotrema nucula]